MPAFDTDILTELLAGNPAYSERIKSISQAEQFVPIVVIEELIRGRLNIIRQAEAGKARVSIEQSYGLFEQTLADLGEVNVLSYTQKAEELMKAWRKQKIKCGTHDLRIAAICVAAATTLVTRNRRDFHLIPDLLVEVWE